jgi:hypothetical protein
MEDRRRGNGERENKGTRSGGKRMNWDCGAEGVAEA